MGNVLAFCEVSGGELRTSALSAISFGRKAAEMHGGHVVALLIGKDLAAAAGEAARYAPRVVTVDDARLEHPMAETYAPIIARIAKAEGASVIGATATSLGKDLLPRVAALTGAGMASDIARVEAKDTFKRAILAGNAFSTVRVSSDPIVV